MSSVSVIVNGADILPAELRAIPTALERDVIRQMAAIAHARVLAGAEAHRKTGKLAQSVYNREITGGRAVGHDTQQTAVQRGTQRDNYARMVLHGTPPHRIDPRNRKVLRWTKLGKFVFAKYVIRHPGYKGDDYLTAAADEAVRQFPNIINKTMAGMKK